MRSVRLLLAVLGFMSAATAAFAQETPKAELSGGYQLERLSQKGEDSETLQKGWYFDVAGNLNKMVGIVGEVGGAYKTKSETERGITVTGDLKIHQFMGGVRLSGRQNPKAVPFGQVLVGGVHHSASVNGTGRVGNTTITINESDSGTDFGLQVGGGVNVKVSAKAGVRVGADYLRVFSEDEGINMFRFTAGIVLGLP